MVSTIVAVIKRLESERTPIEVNKVLVGEGKSVLDWTTPQESYSRM
jgi:hypothetical protein